MAGFALAGKTLWKRSLFSICSLFQQISEADQKQNPTAVVTALKFYANAVMKQKDANRQSPKFMLQQSVTPSDEGDIDEENNRWEVFILQINTQNVLGVKITFLPTTRRLLITTLLHRN